MQEVDGEIMAAEDEILKLQQLNVCLMEQNPDIKAAVENAVAKERQSHEERNAKVLQLLSAKVAMSKHTLLLAMHPLLQFILRLCTAFLGRETGKCCRCVMMSLEVVLGDEFN